EEADETSHGDERSANIDNPWIDEVRDEELWDGEGNAGDQDRRPDFFHAAISGECPDQPEGNDQREEGKLSSHHRAQEKRVEAGHACKTRDRRSKCAISDRRGVGDERKT